MKNDLSIEERLLAAQVAINNSLEDENIQNKISVYGYTVEKLTNAKQLYETADQLNKKQIAEYGDQYAATKAVKDSWLISNSAYINALKIARIVFKNNVKAQGTLLLNGKRKASISGWLDQATVFYSNLLANTDLVSEMAKYSYTEEKLNQENSLVQDVAKAHRIQNKESGEAQDATKKRDAKLDELDEWMADFKVVAKIALAGDEQLLEKLGFFVRS